MILWGKRKGIQGAIQCRKKWVERKLGERDHKWKVRKRESATGNKRLQTLCDEKHQFTFAAKMGWFFCKKSLGMGPIFIKNP